jgi:hypothetical protein
MTDETQAKLEALAGEECKSNTVQNMHSNQCSECRGTRKKWWPLVQSPPMYDGVDGCRLKDDFGYEDYLILAVEQCLGMLGDWSLHHKGRWFIYDSGIPDSVSGQEDRLAAAVECLAEAVNG